MNCEIALDARGRVLRESHTGVASKGKTALPANPTRRSVDVNHASSANILNPNAISDSYLVAIHYPSSSERISQGYRSDSLDIASCYPIAF